MSVAGLPYLAVATNTAAWHHAAHAVARAWVESMAAVPIEPRLARAGDAPAQCANGNSGMDVTGNECNAPGAAHLK